MRRVTILRLTLAGLLATTVPLLSSAQTAAATLSVTAHAEVRIPADHATLVIGVDTRAPTASGAAAENARLSNAVIAALKSVGVDASQISSAGYNVRQDWRYDTDRKLKPNGYFAQNAVRIEITKLDRIGTYVDTSLAVGATRASDITFSATSTEQARRNALSTAMATARGDAEVMAKAAGGSLGRLADASYASSYDQFPRPMAAAMSVSARAEGAEPTTIMSREIIVSASVTTRWNVTFP
jgi:uncharacterized protein YggE